MASFSSNISIRWADIDANFHLRHSVYYDFGSQQRISIFEDLGLTMQVMKENHFGPVIFREECVFKREIKLSDAITIVAKITHMRPDASRYTMQHEFFNAEDQLCAILTLDAAWIDIQKRKLVTTTPYIAQQVISAFPKTGDFVHS